VSQRPSRLALAATACLTLLAAAPAAPTSQGDRAPTRARMQAIFDALSTAINLSLYDTPFEGPQNREMIMQALGVLADNAANLDTHGGEMNRSLDYARRSLARDANEAILRYRQRQFQGTRFVLDQLLADCVACHNKLPSHGEFDLGAEFVKRTRMQQLPPAQRLRLLVATCQFERALDEYEIRFKSKDEPVRTLLSQETMAGYLKLCLCVVHDYDRAVATLSSLRKGGDTDAAARARLSVWIGAINEVRSMDAAGAEMSVASKLVHEARQRFPADGLGLVHFVVASALLQRYLANDPSRPEGVAEAYYLLGVCESHTTSSRWVSGTEFYLETAVRTAPGTPYARRAFDYLESYITSEYTGSGGVLVPEDVTSRLEELRSLIDDAQ
jgi:hypothetical protein